MAIATAQALQFFYARFLPYGLETPFLLLFLYGVYLILAAVILFFALKISGVKVTYIADLPKGVFTIVLRDLLAVPLISLIMFSPVIGIIASFIIWFVMLKFLFQITWLQAFLTWMASGIIQIILIVLVIIPAFLLL